MAEGVGALEVDDGQVRPRLGDPAPREGVPGPGLDEDAVQGADRIAIGVRPNHRRAEFRLGQVRQIALECREVRFPLDLLQDLPRPDLAPGRVHRAGGWRSDMAAAADARGARTDGAEVARWGRLFKPAGTAEGAFPRARS